MAYAITYTESGERHVAEGRMAARRVIESLGLNVYQAARLLDAADGLAALDQPYPLTVERTRVVDFHLDGSPVYAD